MKNLCKRILSVMLSLIMMISVFPLAGLDIGIKAEAKTISEYKTGDIIEFGSYPQSEVTDKTLLSNLNKQKLNWVSYNYYTGTGDWDDGQMKPGDWMKYADITYDGNRYRAVTFSQYRPYSTGYKSLASRSYQDDNGYSINTVYWFKYEPLKWRVLDAKEGLVMCENIIDSQAYSNTVNYYSGDYYNSIYNDANDYATSSIREWLNNDFYHTAFTNSKKSKIVTTKLDNGYWDSTTEDKIFLLSIDEVENADYGFSSDGWNCDTARKAQGTDYAKCQGLYVHTDSSYTGNSQWCLRAYNGDSRYMDVVVYDGRDNLNDYVNKTDIGIRPAMKLSAKTIISDLEADTDNEYRVGDIIEFGSYPQSEVTDKTLLSNLNKQELSWKSYGYYSGNGEYGSMVQGDWMKYADVVYNGNKYRAVTFSKTRPVETTFKDFNYKEINGYYVNKIYWFKYEPLEWIILSPDEGFIMCKTIIDSQPFTNTIYEKEKLDFTELHNERYNYFNNKSFTNYANDYETSSIRHWLNNDFYNVAFSNDEKNTIKFTMLDNGSAGSDYPDFSSNNTNDKVFLLSCEEAVNPEYGFSSDCWEYDDLRVVVGTDYAMIQGLGIEVDENDSNKKGGYWWLRTPDSFRSDAGNGVDPWGCVGLEYGGYIWPVERCFGIRPALRLNLDNIDDDDTGTTEPEVPTSERKTKVFVNKETLNYFENEDIVFVVAEEENGKYYTPEKIAVSNSDENILSLQSIYNYNQFKSLSKFSDFEVPVEYQNGKFIVMTAKKSGMSVVTINNNQTKEVYTFPVGVSVDDYISIRADKIPVYDYQIPQALVYDKYNGYYNGMYIADLSYKKVSGGWNFNMNIYNETFVCGVVEVYDAKGNLIKVEKINKFESTGTGIIKTLGAGWNLITDFVFLDLLSFRGTAAAKETKIKDLYVPQDGCVRVTNNSSNSTMCYVLNLFDAVLTGASVIEGIWNFANSEIDEIENTLLGEFVKNEYYLKFASKYQEKLTEKAFESITESTYTSTVATLAEEANGLLMEIDLDFDDIVKTALGTATGIGEGILLKYADVFGFTLNVLFTARKIANYMTQLNHWIKTSGTGTPFGFATPFVSNSNNTLYSGDKIGVDTNGNVPSEVILQTYRVLKGTINVDLKEGKNPNDFIAYDISLVKDGQAVQPKGKVKVYIPFPIEFEGSKIQVIRKEDNGSWSRIDSVVKNGVITFEVDHFCIFAIAKIGDIDEDIKECTISIVNMPTKTEYKIGETLDTTGLKLKVVYEDGTTKTVTSGFECSPTKFDSAGTKTVNVVYCGATCSFEVTVKKVNTPVKTYTLYYNANGGSGAPAPQTGDVTYTISSIKPTRNGYVFLGWSEKSTAKYADCGPGYSVTLRRDTTLYAVWEEIRCVLNTNKMELNYKSIQKIEPTLSNGNIYSVEFDSSDNSIAMVDVKGNVIATGVGVAEIMVTVTDEKGNILHNKCTVTVSYAWWQWLIVIFLFGWIWY